jgi:hypothetical protein
MKMIATLLIAVLALLGPAVAGAQTTTAPAAPETTKPPTANDPAATTSPAPATPAPATPAPATPGSEPRPGAMPGTPAPDATAPRAQAPGTAGGITESTRDDGRVFGLSPWAAVIGGLVVVGLLMALLAGRGRRDRDVVVESRMDARLTDDRPVGTHESEIERERRRRAS